MLCKQGEGPSHTYLGEMMQSDLQHQAQEGVRTCRCRSRALVAYCFDCDVSAADIWDISARQVSVSDMQHPTEVAKLLCILHILLYANGRN